MAKLRWLLCGVVLAIGACAEPAGQADVEPTASTQQDVTDQQQAQTISRSQALPLPADETCTVTESACKVGQCELGAHDTFSTITEVCCSGGVCTTERYRLCGC
jgi:hypothetical protein